MTNYQDITIALAGVCQAVSLVDELATMGQCGDMKPTLQSLFITQPENTLAVFGGSVANLRKGLFTLRDELTNPDEHTSRYWLSLIALQMKLSKRPDVKAELAQRIARLPEQLRYYDDDIQSSGFIKVLSGIYSDLISPLSKPIRILGMEDILQQPEMQARIRALLLAGLRAAVLWQQVGGSRWRLLFSRKKIIATIDQFLDETDPFNKDK